MRLQLGRHRRGPPVSSHVRPRFAAECRQRRGDPMALNDLRTPDKWMAVVSAALLLVYFALALNALLSPSDDPQRGMADGFIILVAFLLLSMGGVLWFGVARKHPWVVRVVFALTVLPALSQIAQEMFLLVHRAR